MNRLSNLCTTNETAQVSISIRRTPQGHFFHWIVCGTRRYSKRELHEIEMRVRKFLSRCPIQGPETETHSVWL
jgi:hypothetical protein